MYALEGRGGGVEVSCGCAGGCVGVAVARDEMSCPNGGGFVCVGVVAEDDALLLLFRDLCQRKITINNSYKFLKLLFTICFQGGVRS